MKCLIPFLVVIVVVTAYTENLTPEHKETIKKYRKDCLEESGVEEILTQNTLKGDFADDPKLKKYLLCLTKKSNFQNEAGEFQKDVIKSIAKSAYSEEIANNIVACLEQKSTPEESAFAMMKCWHDKSH